MNTRNMNCAFDYKRRNLKFDLSTQERRALRSIDVNVERKNKRFERLSLLRKMDVSEDKQVKPKKVTSKLPVLEEIQGSSKSNSYEARFKAYKERKQKKLEIDKLNKKPVFKLGAAVSRNNQPPSAEAPISTRTRSKLESSSRIAVLSKGNTKPKAGGKFKYDPKLSQEFKIPGVQRMELKPVPKLLPKYVSLGEFKKATRSVDHSENKENCLISRNAGIKPQERRLCSQRMQVESASKLNNQRLNTIGSGKKKNNQINTKSSGPTVSVQSINPPASLNITTFQSDVVTSDVAETEKCSQPREDVTKFRHDYNTEVEKLKALCMNWENIDTENLPSEISGQISSVIGSTQLLLRKKLLQYEGLINDCEMQIGEKKVMPSDLQGFWELVLIQIDDLYKKFEKLEKMKNNAWIEPEEKVTAPRRKSKKLPAAKPKLNVKSGILEHIKAIRKLKEEKASTNAEIFKDGFIKANTPHCEGKVRKSTKARKSMKRDSLKPPPTPHVSNLLMRVSLQGKRQSMKMEMVPTNLFEDVESTDSNACCGSLSPSEPVESFNKCGLMNPIIKITPVKATYGDCDLSIQARHEKDDVFDMMVQSVDSSPSVDSPDGNYRKVKISQTVEVGINKRSYPRTPMRKRSQKASLLPGMDNKEVITNPMDDLIQF